MSVVFEPQRPRRPSGGIGRILVPVAVVIVAAGVLKPWAAADESPGRPDTAVPAASASDSAAAISPSSNRPPPWVATGLPSGGSIRRAVRPHEGWGIRVLVDGRTSIRPPAIPLGLEELWQAAAPPLPSGIASLGDDSSDAVAFATDDRAVRLIGLTVPADVRVEDVRVRVQRPLGRRELVPLREVEVVRRGERYVVLAPLGKAAWQPAVYTVVVDLADTRTAITVVLSDAGA